MCPNHLELKERPTWWSGADLKSCFASNIKDRRSALHWEAKVVWEDFGLVQVFVHIAKCICNALRTVKFECFCQLGAAVSSDKLSALCCFHHSRQPSKKSRPAINNDHLHVALEPPSMHFVFLRSLRFAKWSTFTNPKINQLNVYHPTPTPTFMQTSSGREWRKDLLSDLANLETLKTSHHLVCLGLLHIVKLLS